jgi:hypothetical protein
MNSIKDSDVTDVRSPTHTSSDVTKSPTNQADKSSTDGVSNATDNKIITPNPNGESNDQKIASKDKDKEREKERRRSRSRSPRDSYRRYKDPRDYRDYPPYDYPPYGPPGMPPMW